MILVSVDIPTKTQAAKHTKTQYKMRKQTAEIWDYTPRDEERARSQPTINVKNRSASF